MSLGKILHNIIHSLDRAEKRSFKLYISKYSGNKPPKIATLFNAINNMEVYDNDKLKKAVATSIKASSLNYEKFRLKKQLVNSLCDLYYNGGPTLSVGEVMTKIELGFRLKNIELIEEWIEKGKEVVHNRYLGHFKITLKSYELRLESLRLGQLSKVAKLELEVAELCKDLVKDYQFWAMKDQMGDWYNRNLFSKTKESEKELQVLLQNELFYADDTTLSFNQKRALYYTKELYHDCLKEYENQAIYAKKIVNLYEEIPAYLKATPGPYIDHYGRLIETYIKMSKWQKARNEILRLSRMAEKHEIQCQKIEDYKLYFSCYINVKTKKMKTVYLEKKPILFMKNRTVPFYYFNVLFLWLVDSTFVLSKYDEMMELVELFYEEKIHKKNPKIANQKVIFVMIKIYECCYHLNQKQYSNFKSIYKSIIYYCSKTEFPNHPSINEQISNIIILLKKASNNELVKSDMDILNKKYQDLSPVSFNTIKNWLRKKIPQAN